MLLTWGGGANGIRRWCYQEEQHASNGGRRCFLPWAAMLPTDEVLQVEVSYGARRRGQSSVGGSGGGSTRPSSDNQSTIEKIIKGNRRHLKDEISGEEQSCLCDGASQSWRPPPPPVRRSSAMGISMSRDRYDARAGQTLPLLAFLMLLKYGPAGAARPPVTAALIAANALVYFRPGDLDALLPRLRQVTFNPHLIIKYGDLRRFFLSAFYHTSEAQFFMNMTSLLRTGAQLEASMGSSEFASMVVSLVGLSQGFTLLLSKGLLSLGNHVPYYHFSAGFSGVVLGMNVVLNARAGDVVWFGVAIPAKYVAWLELLLVQALNPEAHLVGNVGGILAGLAYLVLRRGTEPLDLMFSGIADIVSQPVRFAGRLLRSAAAHGPRRSVQGHVASLPRETGRSVQGHVASLPRESGQGMWGCTACSYDNSRCADVCEMCSTPHQDRGFSRRRHLQEGGNRELSVEELSVEEIRRRRLQRFEK